MKIGAFYIIHIQYVLILGLTVNLQYLNAQCTNVNGGQLSATDTNLCINQETTLNLTGSTGTISWQWRNTGDLNWQPHSDIGTSITLSVPSTSDREYRAYVVLDTCVDTSNIITLHISDFAEKPVAWPGSEYCGLKLSSVYADPSVLSGYWSVISGPGNVNFFPSANTNSPDSAIVDTAGTYILSWNITDGICIKKDSATFITYQQNIANAGVDIEQCNLNFNDTVYLNAIPSLPGTTGDWTGSGLTIFDKKNPNTGVIGNPSPSTYKLIWTEYNGLCTDTDTIELYIVRQPVANAGSNDNNCALTDTLKAVPSPYSSYWSQLSGPVSVSFDNSNSPEAIVTAEDYGENFVLEWKLVNGICTDSDTVIINFFEQPVSTLPTIEDACGETTILEAHASTNSSIISRAWSFVTGPQHPKNLTPVNDTVFTVDILPESYGDYTFRWKEINGVCGDSIDVNITFFEQPIPYAGQDINSCGDTIQLHASKSLSESTAWWQVIDNPKDIIFSDSTDGSAIIAVNEFDSYKLIWKELNGKCSATDTVLITFMEIPHANAGLDGDTCGLSYQLSANQSLTGSTGSWSVLTINDTLHVATGFNPIISVDSSGIYQFIWTEKLQQCSSSDNVNITFYYQPHATLVEANDACGYEQTIKVTPEKPDIEYSFSQIEGNGNATFSKSDINGEYNVDVSDTGEYTFLLEASVTPCKADTSFSIHFYEAPVVYAGSDSQLCGKEGILKANLNVGNGNWSLKDGPGTANFSNASVAETTVNINKFGNYTFEWLVNNGACNAAKDEVILQFLETPVADAGLDDNICGTSTVLVATPETGYWHVQTGPTTYMFIPDTLSANAELKIEEYGTYQLIWTATNEICKDTDQIFLNFVNMPSADAGEDQELDNIFETTMQAVAPEDSEFGAWESSPLMGTGNIMNVNSPTTSVNGLSLGENSFIWKVENEFCSSMDTISIFVYDIFIPEIITPNGDGENDIFIITGIENLSPVELTVLNRWGVEVYHSEDYQNDWNGTNKNGSFLTNDTYFYVLNVENRRVFKGFVILKK